jgi:hypothetical protein
MKNYSSKKASKGKLAYRTPSSFIYQKYLKAGRMLPKRKKHDSG